MLESILMRIDAWKRFGFRESPDGSRIVGHTPRDFPDAHLHRFFAPRTEQDWQAYGFKLPLSLVGLYTECNALGLFQEGIVIYGIRAHYQRGDSAQYQPFDLITHNREHRLVGHRLPNQSLDQRVFSGSYEDGSGIRVEGESPEAFHVIRGEIVPSNHWPEMRRFLESEYDRISKLFTGDGYPLRANLCITPPARRGK